MSSVSSKSNSSGQDEAVRNAREEYRKKEAELIKKHNKEIRALNDRYVTELDRKDREQTKNLAGAREKSVESLNRRDMKYRKEMDELRSMHSKQLEKLLAENRAKLDAQTRATRLEVKQANLGKADRTKELHDRYETQHAAEAEKFSQKLEEIRQDQRQSLDEIRSSMKETHEKEIDTLRDERNETVSGLQTDYRRLNQNTNRRLRDQETRHLQNKMRMESSHLDNIRRQEETHHAMQDTAREAFSEGLDDVRDRMAKARERDLEAQASISDSFQSNVKDRIEGQVNRLERDLARAREKNVLEQTREKRAAQKQVDNVRDAYQTKFDHLERARLETLRQSNEINAQNVREIRGETDKLVSDNSRYFRERMDVENFKNRQALDMIENDFKLRQEYLAENADNRVNLVLNDRNVTEKTLRDNFKANIEVMREDSASEKRDLRLATEREKGQLTQVMKEQIQKQEITHKREMADTISKYEKRLADMNDQFVREKRLRDNREKELVKGLSRQKQSEIDALQLQHSDQQKQAQLVHDREVKDLSRRHQEKLSEVLRTVKKT